ncbi:site-specific DNA-methyltransferase [Brucella pseudintermedia]|uniref:site-specific DNA-methyltransferase n=1 Tax=Brucella pseudintermedia TaxID=370111 RepID=UPI0032078BA7
MKAADKVPYRLLQEVSELGYGDRATGNMLIHGDNLDTLKALLPFYAGQVKCIYIDPPYNTRSAFEHYDDNLEHSQWLAMMWPRLELLRELLSEHGSIWVSIDDNEGHYLKVIMDEVFGRKKFIADIAWKRRDGAPNDRKIGPTYDHTIVYGHEASMNLMARTEKADAQYQLYEEPFGYDERGPFRKVDSTGNAKGGRHVESLIYPVTNPFTGEQVYPRKGRCWVYRREVMEAMIADRRYFWGKDGRAGTPMRKLFQTEAKQGMSAPTIWDDVGLNQHAAREIELLFGEKASFETPKPEALLKRVIEIATNPDDLVLDSFLGSGTTAAVAHKMGRRYIGIEMGDHAVTHCQPRLLKVVDGEQGGISQSVNWRGGGGFRFYKLGATVFDETGQIRPDIKFPVLAAHIWFSETRVPWSKPVNLSPVLGIHDGRAYALLYNGILGDKSASGGNVLTRKTLSIIRAAQPNEFSGPITIYGERSALSDASLARELITFKQTPYDVKARA